MAREFMCTESDGEGNCKQIEKYFSDEQIKFAFQGKPACNHAEYHIMDRCGLEGCQIIEGAYCYSI